MLLIKFKKKKSSLLNNAYAFYMRTQKAINVQEDNLKSPESLDAVENDCAVCTYKNKINLFMWRSRELK